MKDPESLNDLAEEDSDQPTAAAHDSRPDTWERWSRQLAVLLTSTGSWRAATGVSPPQLSIPRVLFLSPLDDL